jgi:hypothetical protein
MASIPLDRPVVPRVKELLPPRLNLDTVIGTKRVVTADTVTSEVIHVPLDTTDTDFLCPFARVSAGDLPFCPSSPHPQ